MVYYKLSHVDGRITNPEQRIASDVPRFSSELSDLIQEDLVAVTDGLLYTWRLCSYASPKYLFWILVIILLNYSNSSTFNIWLLISSNAYLWLIPIFCSENINLQLFCLVGFLKWCYFPGICFGGRGYC